MKIDLFTYIGAIWSTRRLVEITVDVRFKKNEFGDRYNVYLANGHRIGWVSKDEYGEHKGTWDAYVSNDAYYPLDCDLLDRIKAHYLHRAEGFKGERVAHLAHTRTEATAELLDVLFSRGAEAILHLADLADNLADNLADADG